VAVKVADQIIATGATYEDQTSSDTTERILREQCGNCLGRIACPVEKLLDERAQLAQAYAKLAMIGEAHPLLHVARLGKINMTEDTLESFLTSEETVLAALANGELNPDTLLAGINNKIIKGGIYRNELPELAHLPGIKGEGPFEAQLVSFGAFGQQARPNRAFVLVDCTRAHSFDRKQPDSNVYRILATKLVDRMREDDHGVPHILRPDSTGQKALRGPGHLDEIRMAKKNRLYFTVSPAQSPDQLHRIILLGAHSGDDKTQEAFIATLRGAY
jgi:hypothetical protein